MKKFFVFAVLFSFIFTSFSTTFARDKRGTKIRNNHLAAHTALSNLDIGKMQFKKRVKRARKQRHRPQELLIKFKDREVNIDTAVGQAKAYYFGLSNKNLKLKGEFKKNNLRHYKLKKYEDIDEAIKRLKKDSSVEHVQPNFQYYPLAVPNDASFDSLWGLNNTGQTVNNVVGITDADMDGPEGWDKHTVIDSNVVVAVIDTGVAYNHPDLINIMWDGSAGCFDDQGSAVAGGCPNGGWGYDAANPAGGEGNNPVPYNNDHGTHVAGIVASEANNSIGVAGIGRGVKIMALQSDLTSASILKSINFAKNNGAKVINASYGAPANSCNNVYDSAVFAAIQSFDGLFIAAAGNDTENHDGSSYFGGPSDYGHDTTCWSGLSNVISVASTNSNDELSTFSDYGADYIDVGAPGSDIYSTMSGSVWPVLEEDFEGITPPALPAEFTATGNWGTVSGSFNVLAVEVPYSSSYTGDANTTFTSPTINLSTSNAADMTFFVYCDTEYSAGSSDYLALEFSNDGGGTYTEISRFHEYVLDDDTNEANNTGIIFYPKEEVIDASYLNSNFQFQFRWVTDSTDNNYSGCMLNDLKVTIDQVSDGTTETYDFMSGTSMATPYVSGLAGAIMSNSPQLTNAEVKSVILDTGDSLTALATTTVTGKRINLNNALTVLESPVVNSFVVEDESDANTSYTSGDVKFTINATDNNNIDGSANTLSSYTIYDGSQTQLKTGTFSTGTTEEVIDTTTATGTTGTVTSLTYYVDVQDKDGHTSSRSSDTISLDKKAPSDPIVDSFTNGETSVDFTFETFADDGIGGVEIKNCPTNTDDETCSTWSTSTSYSKTGLSSNTAYNLYSKTRDSFENETSLSNIYNYTTLSQIGDITNATAAIYSQNASTANEIQLTWDLANDSKVTISRDTSDLACSAALNEVLSNSALTSLVDTSLLSNTDYFYRLFAVNSNDEINTADCIKVSQRTVPPQVQNLVVTENAVNPDDITVTVSWGWDTVYEADSYLVYLNSAATGESVSGTSYSKSDFDPNVAATLQVSAVRSGEEGTLSAISNVTTTSLLCGDGVVDTGEDCDDGNEIETDSCLSTCVNASCGDGFVEAGEEDCDDGNEIETDSCLNTCVAASCGDGFVEAGEEDCDDGNAVETDSCLSTCVAASCGDGFVEDGEEDCDDGNAIETDSCLSTCVVASCGDGFVEDGEETCDDNGVEDGDGCSAACLLEGCGNSVVDSGESCDDGNVVSGDGCDENCAEETDYKCLTTGKRCSKIIDVDTISAPIDVIGSISVEGGEEVKFGGDKTDSISVISEEVCGKFTFFQDALITSNVSWNGILDAPECLGVDQSDESKISAVVGKTVDLIESFHIGNMDHAIYFDDPVLLEMDVVNGIKDQLLHAFYSHDNRNTWHAYEPSVTCIVNSSKKCDIHVPHFSDIGLLEIGDARTCESSDWETGSWNRCSSSGVQVRSVTQTGQCVGESGKPASTRTCTPRGSGKAKIIRWPGQKRGEHIKITGAGISKEEFPEAYQKSLDQILERNAGIQPKILMKIDAFGTEMPYGYQPGRLSTKQIDEAILRKRIIKRRNVPEYYKFVSSENSGKKVAKSSAPLKKLKSNFTTFNITDVPLKNIYYPAIAKMISWDLMRPNDEDEFQPTKNLFWRTLLNAALRIQGTDVASITELKRVELPTLKNIPLTKTKTENLIFYTALRENLIDKNFDVTVFPTKGQVDGILKKIFRLGNDVSFQQKRFNKAHAITRGEFAFWFVNAYLISLGDREEENNNKGFLGKRNSFGSSRSGIHSLGPSSVPERVSGDEAMGK